MTRTPLRTQAPQGVGRVLGRLALPILATYAFIPLTYLVPLTGSTRPPDLASWLALWAYVIAQTGGTTGASVLGAALLVLLATRAGVAGRRRPLEAVVVLAHVMILGSGGAALNEHVIKPMFEVPRPNIAYLAGSEGSGPLGMPASAFYALEDEDARRESLRAVLEADPPVIRMHHLIREHWIEETGYSFPSGHSFSAMFIATFFLAMGLTWFSLPRLLPFYLLLPWAVCVSYSRPMLWLHTPADIAAGGLEGLVLGVVAYVLARGSLAARLGIRSGGALATQRR